MLKRRFGHADVRLPQPLLRRLMPPALVLAATYLAFPYLVLFQLSQAIRHGDAAELQQLVDWYQVREGLKEDVCDAVIDAPPDQAQSVKAGETLAPFGYSFVRGVSGNLIDQNVTPDGLVAAAHGVRAEAAADPGVLVPVAPEPAAPTAAAVERETMPHGAMQRVASERGQPDAGEPSGSMPRVTWAFFDTPTSFSVWLQPADPRIGPIHVLLELHQGAWKVERAWLPPALLMRANTRI